MLFTSSESAKIEWKKQKFPLTYKITLRLNERDANSADVVKTVDTPLANEKRFVLILGY